VNQISGSHIIKLFEFDISFDPVVENLLCLTPFECQNPDGILNSDVFGKANVLSNEIFPSNVTPVKIPPPPPNPSIKTLSFENKKCG